MIKATYNVSYLLLVFCLTLSLSAFSQKRKHGIDYPLNVTKLIEANNIVWYGVDFSKSRISDATKIKDATVIKEKYIPSWIYLMNKRYDLKYIQKKIKKYTTEDLNSIQKLYTNINEEELVLFSDYSFPIDSVKSYVSSYSMPQSSGVGLVLIIENLNKPNRFISGYFVFFDLTTREVLHATKMKGLPGSKYGFTQWWKEGMIELFDYYFNRHCPL